MNKKAAMEMSVGTIVTIVLLMTVLVLGLVLVRTIFTSAIDNVKGIDTAVKNQINKLFSEDSSRRLIVYPETRRISLKKDSSDAGFAFSIRNVGEEVETFSYNIEATGSSCESSLSLSGAQEYLFIDEESGIEIPAGSVMENPVHVTFQIPSDAPPCKIRYNINVKKRNDIYSSSSVDVTIESD